MQFDGVSKRSRMMPLAFSHMISLLMEAPHSYAELAEKTGLCDKTIRAWLAPMRKKSLGYPRLVRIGGWATSSTGYRKPEFEFAPGRPDVPRPRQMTGAERQQRVRDKKRGLMLATVLRGTPIAEHETASAVS